MKKCQSCESVYSDENLIYCVLDGKPLSVIDNEPSTWVSAPIRKKGINETDRSDEDLYQFVYYPDNGIRCDRPGVDEYLVRDIGAYVIECRMYQSEFGPEDIVPSIRETTFYRSETKYINALIYIRYAAEKTHGISSVPVQVELQRFVGTRRETICGPWEVEVDVSQGRGFTHLEFGCGKVSGRNFDAGSYCFHLTSTSGEGWIKFSVRDDGTKSSIR